MRTKKNEFIRVGQGWSNQKAPSTSNMQTRLKKREKRRRLFHTALVPAIWELVFGFLTPFNVNTTCKLVAWQFAHVRPAWHSLEEVPRRCAQRISLLAAANQQALVNLKTDCLRLRAGLSSGRKFTKLAHVFLDCHGDPLSVSDMQMLADCCPNVSSLKVLCVDLRTCNFPTALTNLTLLFCDGVEVAALVTAAKVKWLERLAIIGGTLTKNHVPLLPDLPRPALLRVLTLGGWWLTDDVLESIVSGVPLLQELRLASRVLDGSSLASVPADLTLLYVCGFRRASHFPGSNLVLLARLTKLKVLCLDSHDDIRDEDLHVLSALPLLEFVGVSRCENVTLADETFKHFPPNVRKIDASRSGATKRVWLNRITNLPRLVAMYMCVGHSAPIRERERERDRDLRNKAASSVRDCLKLTLLTHLDEEAQLVYDPIRNPISRPAAEFCFA